MKKEVRIAGAAALFFLLLTITVSVIYAAPKPEKQVGVLSVGTDTAFAGPLADSYLPQTMGSLDIWEAYPAAEYEPVDTAASKEIEPVVYILKDKDGYVAIYQWNAEGEPSIVTEIHVSTLRSADAEKLREGIQVVGVENLAKIIEDLNS